MELKEFAKSADGALRIITTLWKMKQSRKRGKEMGNNCNCKHNHNSNSDEPCCGCDNRQTHADRIRNMSDEEMAKRIASSPNFNCADYCDSFSACCAFNCNKKGREIALKWLQSEVE